MNKHARLKTTSTTVSCEATVSNTGAEAEVKPYDITPTKPILAAKLPYIAFGTLNPNPLNP